MRHNQIGESNYTRLNVSQIARELVYGRKPRIPNDKLVTYEEMRNYVTQALSMAFGQYIHGLEYGLSKDKFSKIYQSKGGINCKITAIPDAVSPPLITEEKCTFNSYKIRDATGEMQLQLEGFVCDSRIGILKVRHIHDSTVSRHLISLNESTAINLIEKYLGQTLLPYL